ncbi:hypothetical protein LNTAR_18128 [Lentisphaera araneosa HTCC2155]|uniref:GSCFA domain-containing protein n=1 Tax=Lentisphaera araneosa HTCC2155 TaxID=313628 RepID=A6DFW4_9BACT|nr:GSCFA domain-containing protein [Lentisphaera araneosa]EDM29694.1 hypothetical protein LNTAR_18128 [Lentisphaera araneosa HTCC2155]
MKLFRTEIIPQQTCPERLSWQNSFISLGSCFADKSSKLLQKSGVKVYSNPTGVLYNPQSIADLINNSLEGKVWSKNECVIHEKREVFPFIQGTQSDPIKFINDTQTELLEQINNADVLLVTFGTAWAYRLLTNNEVVANCHKLPSQLFKRQMLDLDSIYKTWNQTILKLQENKPELKIIFTVSPVRHLRDDFRDNQISKSTLHLAIEKLVKHNENCFYFPAYEIMMDDLRDYRFYSEDMAHPSDEATAYILDKFIKSSFDQASEKYFLEAQKISSMFEHKLLNPESEDSQKFILSRQKKAHGFLKKYPSSLLAINV